MDTRMSIQLINGFRIEDFQDPAGEWGCVVTDAEKTFMSVTSRQLTRQDAIDDAMRLARQKKDGEKKKRN